MKPTSTIDRLPPHSIEAEQALLGCILLSPLECLGTCLENNIKPESFYDVRHQTIYVALTSLFEKNSPIDVVTVHEKLKAMNELESVGGLPYLAVITDATPSAANVGYYLEIVKEAQVKRDIIRKCTETVQRIYEQDGDTDQLLDSLQQHILNVNKEGKDSTVHAKELVAKSLEKIERFHENKGAPTGISTGFTDWDKRTLGLQPGEMIVVAARPSVGKTSLALNIAEHAAVDLQLPTAVFSLEMPAEAVMLRMLCARARIDLRSVRDGFLSERDLPKLTMAAGKLAHAPLWIDDASDLSILQLRSKARRLHQQHGIKLFIVDYLQLLHSTSRRADTRAQEVAYISAGCKALAKECNAPVLVLSQLNRDVEQRESGKPKLSELRESGAIEQDADVVCLLYRTQAQDAKDEAEPIRMLIAKNRNGPTGEVDLTFIKGYTRFESAAKD